MKKNKNFKFDKNLTKDNKYILEFKDVSFFYNKNQQILKNINFKIDKSKFITILGPSGCGKTTILKLIGGFEELQKGSILYKNKSLKNIPPNKRNIRTIFQHLGLFPHYNVFNNIAYSLKIQKKPKNFINNEVEQMLKLVSLENYNLRSINELSGGEKQRVAFARSLITKPEILLLDEPFSALDIKLKKNMELEVRKIQRKIKATFILVTHDQEQALLLSDKLIILNDGKIEQQGNPINIYNEPINEWVAKFIGSSTIINDAIFIKDNYVKWDNVIFKTIDKGFNPNEKVDVCLRPEDIYICDVKVCLLQGTIINIIFKGVHWNIFVKCKNRIYEIHTTKYYEMKQNVGIKWDDDAIHVMKKKNNNENTKKI